MKSAEFHLRRIRRLALVHWLVCEDTKHSPPGIRDLAKSREFLRLMDYIREHAH